MADSHIHRRLHPNFQCQYLRDQVAILKFEQLHLTDYRPGLSKRCAANLMLQNQKQQLRLRLAPTLKELSDCEVSNSTARISFGKFTS